MKSRLIPNIVSIYIVFLISWPVYATNLSLESSAANVAIGGTFNVDLKISGLADQTAPSLSSFFAEVVYEGKFINFESVTYGNFLGEPTDPDQTDIVTIPEANKVSLDETSFLTTTELDALQPADFTLATLIFKASSAGSTTITFEDIDFSDADANSFIPVLEITSVNVIPLPGAFLLFLSAFCSLVLSARKPDRL